MVAALKYVRESDKTVIFNTLRTDSEEGSNNSKE